MRPVVVANQRLRGACTLLFTPLEDVSPKQARDHRSRDGLAGHLLADVLAVDGLHDQVVMIGHD